MHLNNNFSLIIFPKSKVTKYPRRTLYLFAALHPTVRAGAPTSIGKLFSATLEPSATASCHTLPPAVSPLKWAWKFSAVHVAAEGEGAKKK